MIMPRLRVLKSLNSDSSSNSCHRSVIISAILFGILTALTFLPQLASSVISSNVPNVVVIDSYHHGYNWSDKEIVGFLERMREVYPLFDPPVEHLDAKRHPEEDNFVSFKDRLRDKYKGQKIDLIVAFDNPALELLLQFRSELFPGVPVVFGGINDFDPMMLKGQKDVTGVAEIMDDEKTLDIALKLHPNTREVFVIHDYTSSGLAVRKEFERLLPKYSERLRFRFTDPTTIEEAVGEVRSLARDSLGIILSYTTDRDNRSLSLPESTRLLTSSSPVPIYALHETRLGHGIVGGQLIGPVEHGRRVAGLAMRVLSGEKLQSVPVDMSGSSRPMFHYPQLERFGIDLNALPPGSIIVDRPKSFFELYKTLTIGTITLVTILSILVIGLVTSLLSRRKAQNLLEKSEAKYRRFVETANEGVWAMDGNYRTTFVNQRMAAIMGYTTEEMLGKPVDYFFFEEDLANHRKNMELRRQGGNQSYERRFRRKDGTTLWTIVSATALKDGRGNFLGSFAMFTDITDKKRAEETLREKEQQYRLLAENTVDVIWQMDPDLRFTYVNQAILRATGYTRDELVGSRLADYCDEDTFNKMVQAASDLVSHGVDAPGTIVEAPMLKKNGQLFWAEIHARALFDDDGLPIGFQGVSRDITERKNAQEKLKISENRFRTLLETAPSGFWATDRFGKNTYVSPYWSNLTGISQEEARGEGWARGLHPDDRDKIFRGWLERASKDESYSSEFRFIHPHGRCVWVLCQALAVKTDDGSVCEWLGTITDITDRKMAEEALRESEKRYRAVVDNLQIGISVINRKMEIVAVNPFFAAYYPDVQPGSGQICYIAYNDPPRTSPCSYCPCALTFQDGEVHESETETPAGNQVRNYRIVSCPIKDESGEVQLVIELVEDVTERKLLYSQLAHAQKMEAVGTLAGGIAHDFNNILQVVIGHAELMYEDGRLPENFKAGVSSIYNTAIRGAELVQRLLTFSRKADFKPQPIDINRRITDLRNMLERTIPKMIHIVLSLSKDIPMISADPTQIDQVLMNLAVNARDAMPVGGNLMFETTCVIMDEDDAKLTPMVHPGPYVLLTVTDTGSGMDDTTLSHLCEPFYTTKMPGKGTGLGLAMVHGIVEQHGGFLTCESKLGFGTSFKVYLPAIDSKIEVVHPMARGPELRGTETILLVDDDDDVRGLCQQVLEKAGYKVNLATNGKEALEVYNAGRNEISLVLLDLIMPEMSGLTCLEKLLELNPLLKVIIISGNLDESTVSQSLAAGAKSVVHKPFVISNVLEALRNVLE